MQGLPIYRASHTLSKPAVVAYALERGQLPRLALAHQHFHYFVTFALHHLLERQCLGEMPPTLALNNKYYLHLTSY